jgi:hypothetical protein
MSNDPGTPRSEADSELEREIRERRKFALAEAERVAGFEIRATLDPVPDAAVTTRHDAESTLAYSQGSPAAGSRFAILRPHARGGLGQISVALDGELHRELALKELRPERADDPNSRTRFVLEGEITGRLEHTGVVPLYGLGRDAQGRPFYATRFVKGQSLKEAIDRFQAGRLVGSAHFRGCRLENDDRCGDLARWAAGPGLDAVIASAVRYAERNRQDHKTFS